MQNQITLIGDVHGKYDRYHKILMRSKENPYTVQLGDLGFRYDVLKPFDPKCHVFIGGNHDQYDIINDIPHYLGNYGYVNNFNGFDFFFYRGAYSIDRQYRTIGIDWWSNEENNIETFMKARDLYRDIKPDIMLTHDCPEFLVRDYIGPHGTVYQNITNWALQELYNIHQPKLWVHGHHHLSKTTIYGNTKFVCLDELETYILTKDSY